MMPNSIRCRSRTLWAPTDPTTTGMFALTPISSGINRFMLLKISAEKVQCEHATGSAFPKHSLDDVTDRLCQEIRV